jgi:hypothetical protein
VKIAALLVLPAALVAASVALAASPRSPVAVGIAQAIRNTERVAPMRFITRDTIVRGRRPTTLTARGAIARGTYALRLGVAPVWLGKLKLPGREAAALIDGPFIYLRAPSSITVNGVDWLREPLAALRPNSRALSTLHAFGPKPLLRMLAETRLAATGEAGVYIGSPAYDDPIVRMALRRLTGNVEFRALAMTAWVGRDGLVRRILVQGRTADGKATLTIRSRLFAFGRPVSVTPPRLGTFMDNQLFGLDE